ncbi:MAG TPA: DUF488 family protein [Methanobacterium subterraneum]|uniref:DUF488 family protein n=1 Tax=Methanobacterium subterraneum TaxID=59277 RepID=A0A7J4TJD6_9EURY|nr:DUF488 family protein [Methanobacterium subterraneum]
MLKIKGIYQLPEEEDGFRILIDESWPENLSREEAQVDLWLKDISPPDPDQEGDMMGSADVRGENPGELWRRTAIKLIRATEKEKGTVTFVCSTLQSIKQLQF